MNWQHPTTEWQPPLHRRKLKPFTAYLIIANALMLALAFINIAVAQTNLEAGANSFYPKIRVARKPVESAEETIRRIAKEENYDPEYLVKLAQKESSMDQYAIHINKNKTLDLGIFQWNPRYHPEVDAKCSFDIACATKKTIEALKAGHKNWWIASKYID